MKLAYYPVNEMVLNVLMDNLYGRGYSWATNGVLDLETGDVIYADKETKTLVAGSLELFNMARSINEDISELITVQLRGATLSFVKKPYNDIRPNYYKNGGHDLFDHFTEIMPTQGFRGFMIGNIFKYVTRYPAKNGIEDLRKAQTYLNRLIEFEETKDHENH